MDKTRILQQGEEAKFKIEISDFDMSDGEFKVVLVWGYRRHKMEILKSQMVNGSDGKWYFTFDTTDMVGRVNVECTWQVNDTDFPDGYREERNEQYLCFVASTPCPQFVSCPACSTSDLPVTYTRTEQSSIADLYAYLGCADYDRILTCDDEVILVLKEIENNNNE